MSVRCHDVRRLFGAYWDDETTQAEREWIEAHFAGCTTCRREYDEFTCVLEALTTLPRVEASPDLLERTLARTRRVSPAQDVLPARRPTWVPATAAAALLLAAVAGVMQWAGVHRGPVSPGNGAATVGPVATAVSTAVPSVSAPAADPSPADVTREPMAAVADSVFNHSDDIEFVLDPVTLRRGRAAVTRELPGGIRTEKAVVSF